jgi:hypothetical protein
MEISASRFSAISGSSTYRDQIGRPGIGGTRGDQIGKPGTGGAQVDQIGRVVTSGIQGAQIAGVVEGKALVDQIGRPGTGGTQVDQIGRLVSAYQASVTGVVIGSPQWLLEQTQKLSILG